MNQVAKAALAVILFPMFWVSSASAFCGFYVGKADTDLYNEASKVVLVRDGDRTVVTMANDYQGELEEFALVVPVPTFIEEGQIHVTSNSIIEHLDAYTAPRLAEYYDENPCRPTPEVMANGVAMQRAPNRVTEAEELGVTIEAEYTVEEYDIVILSAEQSDGLETWLKQNGYKIPDGASEVLGSYIRQNMRFFVAKVNMKEQERLGYTFLRPLSVAYESPKFMLPIRLGTVNSKGTQELFVFAITRTGRVETTNYRTVRLPSNVDLPLFVEDEFGSFYKAMFDRQVEKENMKAVFLEYAWDMSWCDPCAANPLSRDELLELGVFWLLEDDAGPQRVAPSPAQNAFVTRLHVRYDAAHFPEDLLFQTTGDRTNFQGRYILRHPWTGEVDCKAGRDYVASLPARFAEEANTLARLTGWDIEEIRAKMKESGQRAPEGVSADDGKTWWEKLWPF